MTNLICARIAWSILSIVVLTAWLSLVGGCSVDNSGFDSPLAARGEVDTGTPVVEPDGGAAGVDVSPTQPQPETIDAQSTTDLGFGSGPDTQSQVGDSAGEPNPVTDAGNSPAECPLEPSRSLSSCSGAQTLALCRYTLDGHPAIQIGCTAEGYLCVKMCP